jgi:hypothetical protein
MKRCPKCGQMHQDTVLTCDCGQSLNLIEAEEKKHQRNLVASSTSAPSTSAPSTSAPSTSAPSTSAPLYSATRTGSVQPSAQATPVLYTNNVTLTAIDIPFWDLMSFMFKLTFAALPAVFAATLVWMLLLGFLSALFGGSLLALLLR